VVGHITLQSLQMCLKLGRRGAENWQRKKVKTQENQKFRKPAASKQRFFRNTLTHRSNIPLSLLPPAQPFLTLFFCSGRTTTIEPFPPSKICADARPPPIPEQKKLASILRYSLFVKISQDGKEYHRFDEI